jgi:hypothetical protein
MPLFLGMYITMTQAGDRQCMCALERGVFLHNLHREPRRTGKIVPRRNEGRIDDAETEAR